MSTATRLPTQNPLTLEVLRGLAQGLSDVEVARRHDISVRTVQRLVDSFKIDVGARTRFAAGVAAVRLGLLHPDAHLVDTEPADRRW